MMKSITSSIELEELLAEHQNLALLVSGNQCSLSSLGQKELIDTAEREHLVLYQADIFQVPRLISLFGIQPTLTSLLVFKKGQLVDKKEVYMARKALMQRKKKAYLVQEYSRC